MKKFAILFSLLLLAACAGDDDGGKTKTEAKTDKKAAAKFNTDNMICPQVAIVRQARDLRDYGGEAPDPGQLVAAARMTKIEGDCAYREDGVDISFTLHMVARRGPRLGGDQASFPYFIAALDPANAILSRQIVTAHFDFSGSGKTASDDEVLHVFIPLTAAALPAGPDYRVLVGFKGTPGTE